MLQFLQILVLAVVVVARQVPETPVHENIEFPLSHYRRLYEEALDEHEVLGLDKRQKACPAEAVCQKKVAACPGFTLLTKDNEGEQCSSLKIGKQTLELKPVIFYPIKGSKCCAARQCVVSDCKAVLKEFQFDGTKKCTKNGKPEGPVDKCQVRKPKHVCGCDVKMCLKKECEKLPECDAKCFKKNIKFDECQCIKIKGYCTIPPPSTDQCLKDGSKKCKKCQVCSDETAFPGCDKIVKGAKGKELTKVKKCKPIKCPKTKVCDPCTKATKTTNDGCCIKVECEPLKLPSCKAPTKGKCGGCEKKVSQPQNPLRKECKTKIECCIEKKCPLNKKKCPKCHKTIPKKDKCGCATQTCKRIPQDDDLLTEGATSYYPGLTPKKAVGSKKTHWCSKPEKMTKPEAVWVEFREKVIVAKVSFKGRTGVKDAISAANFPTKFDLIASNDKKKWVTVVSFEDKKVYRPSEGSRSYPVPFIARKEYYKVYGIRIKEVKGRKIGKRPVKRVCIGDIKFTIVNNQYCNGCQTKVTKKVFMGNDPKCPNHKKHCIPKPCKGTKPCTKCQIATITEDKCKCPVKKCYSPPPVSCKKNEPGKCPKEVPAQPGCPSEGGRGVVTVCETCHPPPPTPCPLPVDPPCPSQCNELATEYVRQDVATLNFCKKRVCKAISKCINSPAEAQERLNCKGCKVPVKTNEKLKCGCHKWECKPYPKPPVCPTCPSCKEPKITTVKGCDGASKCECLPKACPKPSPCEEYKVDRSGKVVKGDCNCDKIVEKACTSVPTEKCTPGKSRLVTVIDKCKCPVTGEEPCGNQKIPTCSKCETLVTENDGDCCKKYKCVKKVCKPLNKNLECKKCEKVVVKDDECHCCKATCEPVKCNPVGKCKGTGKTAEEPVLIEDECNCKVKIGCKPPGDGGEVVSCPKPDICESEVRDLKMCKHCYENE